MISKNKGKRKSFKIARRVRATMLLIPLAMLIMAVGLFIYAKYYTHNQRHGVAVAGSIYFTSNYAVKSDSEDDIFECVVAAGYQGMDYNFDFEVRNYENVMLFNDSSVVIPYSVYFWLGEETDTATYTVEYDGEVITILPGEDNKTGFSNQNISGGKALSNNYKITIDVLNEDDDVEHKAVPIYVEVVTDQGAVINRTLRGKMILSSTVRAETYVEAAEFVISKDIDVDTEGKTDEEIAEEIAKKKFEEIEKLSELTYEIRTVGEVVSDEMVSDELKLSWDPTVFEIDLYDSAYLAWIKESGKDEPGMDSNGWYYITIEVMPYSSNIVYFLRGEEFETKVTDLNSLNSYIKVEKYQESTLDSEEGTE